jgi:hypothetical protein
MRHFPGNIGATSFQINVTCPVNSEVIVHLGLFLCGHDRVMAHVTGMKHFLKGR